MELRPALRLLRRRWRIEVAALLLAMVAGGAWISAQPRNYTASTEAFVAVTDNSGNSVTVYQGGLFSQQRVKSYVEIIKSPLILDPVRRALNLPIDNDDLEKKISAIAPLDTVIVTISVEDTSPTLARDIANKIVEEFANAVPKLESRDAVGAASVRVTVIRPADLPVHPSSPNVKLDLALAFICGLVIGILGAVVRESLDSAVRDAEDVSTSTGSVPIGLIPRAGKSSSALDVFNDSLSGERSEAFGRLRTNLQFVEADNPPRAIAVTSAMASEGKSTVSCSLALSLAHAGARVALVETDLRRPAFAKYLGVEPSVGLTSVLVGIADLSDCLQEVSAPNLVVLASGPIPPNPSELLGSKAMSELVNNLLRQFDYVVFDTAPLLPVPDGAVVSAMADGVLMVAKVKSTKRDQLDSAIQSLRTVDARLLGVVLNGVPVKEGGMYSYKYSATGDHGVLSHAMGRDPISPAYRRAGRHGFATVEDGLNGSQKSSEGSGQYRTRRYEPSLLRSDARGDGDNRSVDSDTINVPTRAPIRDRPL